MFESLRNSLIDFFADVFVAGIRKGADRLAMSTPSPPPAIEDGEKSPAAVSDEGGRRGKKSAAA